ncbi:hypothetical protein IMCC14465_06170 [alpha proteobacterium IMCC14465]|uniref:Outer membrane protein beta-barrel domain-containing protein n=1 Tax=alpha proteobacterium IMCC14465 TaxID=1220535 RepID=J9DG08_9PROT|nr:hypothetical protein IMCC14465_06170 [alpha proteobacterium IMCC14465]
MFVSRFVFNFVSNKVGYSPFLSSIFLPLLLVLPALSQAQAQSENETATHFYVTAGAVLESNFEFAGNLNNLEEEGSGYYLGGGYSFSEMISLEVGYTEANDYSNNGGQYSDVKMYELSGMTHLRFENPFSPYLRLGLYHASSDDAPSPEIDDTGILYGVGVDYSLSEGQFIRLDFTPGNAEGDELDRLMIGLVVDLQK